ncbi:NADH dehydrogenase (quinone) subunit D [Sulfurospirillum diekertiae]|uniref:NADH-quinone oxidoreductase subunit C/D n=1 Tax=Sulfurospirillum diekertiae TaxID=1854492 RepID=A0A1Y0HHV0_9BACT|nr:NADH dehydrogenase (quinone) subunit D [Sulfurospirillum diekertiae]ARU47648.1 NADH-quinone oxidoreductase subunit C/D [Sulfurospirillum diekertiae]ASC92494.1 NADH-quinone oxidoreductase subunit C/D [Sulfurospirillum diekertiae]
MPKFFKETLADSYTIDAYGAFILDKALIVQALHILKEKDHYTFLVDMTAIDYLHVKNQPERFAIVYLLRDQNFKNLITLKTYIDSSLATQSITSLFKSANWAEREIWDQYGIHFKNHPNLKRILNHKEFKGHPLRKDYPITQGQLCHQSDDLMDEMTPCLKTKGFTPQDELMFLNLGPAHPASHGTIRTFVALDGENITCAVSEIGYLHRGFEKSCENHTYNQIIPYTDRLNYCSAILNNIAYAHAVEGILGVDLPERAKFIRVIVGELSRIIDHLVCLAAILVDMGALTNYWYLYNPREKVYDLLSKLTGARLTNSYMRIGGMSHDLYDGFENDLNVCLKEIEQGVTEALKLIEHNRIFHDRTQNVGIITKEDAINRGLTGPNLRASGVAYDLRVTAPYYHYETFDFDIALGSVGDVYDRMMVRFEEIKQSTRIINQAMQRLPKGAICVPDHAISLPPKKEVYNNIEGLMNQFKLIYEGVKVPASEYYRAIEGANGELGFFIVSDGSGTPYKIKVRPPCFYAMAAYPRIIEGSMIADAVLTLGSLNIIAGELDR